MTEAFLSYTRKDNEFHGGIITDLRKALELGVQVATGDRHFSIFQDVEDIRVGNAYQERIDRAIDIAVVFIPIVTPSFFTSKSCSGELERFLSKERRIGRRDLILPIYFVTASQFERAQVSPPDPLAQELRTRQHVDWRQLADERVTRPSTRRAVKKLASAIGSVAYSMQTSDFQRGVEGVVDPGEQSDQPEVDGKQTGPEEIPGDFQALKQLFDWQKFHHAVGTWAAYQHAPNPYDMGPQNFRRCLFDLGIPGGRAYELEHEGNGALRYR